LDTPPEPDEDATFRRTLVLLTLAGLAVRAALLVLEPATSPVADERTWTDWARIVAERPSPLRHKMIFHPPLYPYFLAGPFALTGSFLAAQVLQVFVSVLLIPAVGRVGALTLGRRAGVVAAAITAFYPELVWFSVHFWVENVFLVLLWWAFERLLVADASGRRRHAAAAGLLWGAAILARETALYFLPVAAAWLALRRGRTGAWPAGAARAAIVLAAAVLVVAPWTYRNWLAFEAFVPVSTAGGQNLFQGNARIPRDETYRMVDEVQGRIEQYRYARGMGLEAIRERQPGWILEKLGEQMPLFWEAESMALIHLKRGAYGKVRPGAALALSVVMLVPYLAVIALAVRAIPTLPLARGIPLLLLFLAYYNAIHVVAHGFNRYRLPVMPVLFLMAAWGWGSARTAIAPSPLRRGLALAAVAVLVASVVPSLLTQWRHCAYGLAAPRESAIVECPSR
jgi:4-amino-4-deoxy-L-arabinose transferase-like glycosyltransferase